MELVRKHAKERPAGSRKVIDELLPDPKALEAMKSAVVGTWLTDDDEKIPLDFAADGTAKVGFIKENEKWIIAVGKYALTSDGKVKAEVKHEGSILFQTWTLKDGVLVGSHGPRPMVRWVKINDAKEEK